MVGGIRRNCAKTGMRGPAVSGGVDRGLGARGQKKDRQGGEGQGRGCWEPGVAMP